MLCDGERVALPGAKLRPAAPRCDIALSRVLSAIEEAVESKTECSVGDVAKTILHRDGQSIELGDMEFLIQQVVQKGYATFVLGRVALT